MELCAVYMTCMVFSSAAYTKYKKIANEKYEKIDPSVV